MANFSDLFNEYEAERLAIANSPEALATERAAWNKKLGELCIDCNKPRILECECKIEEEEELEPERCDSCGETVSDCNCDGYHDNDYS